MPGSATTSRRSYYAAAQIVIQATSENIAITTDRPLDEELLRNDASTKKLTLRLVLGQARFWNTGMLVPTHEGRAELLNDITSTAKISEEPLGWNAMVKPYLRPDTAIFLESDAEDGLEDGQRMSLSILLGQFVGYNISAPETVTVRVSGPPVLSTASRRRQVSASFVIRATAGQAVLTGAMDEASIRSGASHTLQVSLVDAEWSSSMYSGTDGDSQEQLIEALVSDQTELLGYNHVLREGITRNLVSAQSGLSSVLITVPGNVNYRIIDPETIRLLLPAATVSTRLDSPVTGYVVINATAGNASLIGDFPSNPSESYLRAPSLSQDFYVVLVDDEWTEATLIENGRMREEAMLLVSSTSAEPHGWNSEVVPDLPAFPAQVLNSTHLRLTLGSFPLHDITAPETLSLTVPSLAVRSRQTIELPSALVVRALSGEARLGGTLVYAALAGPLVNITVSQPVSILRPLGFSHRLALPLSVFANPVDGWTPLCAGFLRRTPRDHRRRRGGELGLVHRRQDIGPELRPRAGCSVPASVCPLQLVRDAGL